MTRKASRRRTHYNETEVEDYHKPADEPEFNHTWEGQHDVEPSGIVHFPLSITITSPSLSTAPEMPKRFLPLLICSIGNPGPQYADTLHSAGHTLLHAIRQLLNQRHPSAAPTWPAFAKDKPLGGSHALISRPSRTDFDGSEPPDWTLVQSTSYMNVSGKGVCRTLKNWITTTASRSETTPSARHLVVLHDDLESPPGQVRVRGGGAGESLRGHNGLKDIAGSLSGGTGGQAARQFWRIGVGIGRPQSRDSEAVSRHVTAKMSPQLKAKVVAAAGEVVEALERIAEGE